LVIEGYTEVGMLLGLKEFWPEYHDSIPIEQLGAALVDGNGHQALSITLALHELGYEVCLFRDSDEKLKEGDRNSLSEANIPVVEYGDEVNTEQAVFLATDNDMMQKFLDFVIAENDVESVASSIASKVEELTPTKAQSAFSEWCGDIGTDPSELRRTIGNIAHKKRWFKEQRLGREVAPLVWATVQSNPTSDLSKTLKKVENWLYG
jgi:hypothetical protein